MIEYCTTDSAVVRGSWAPRAVLKFHLCVRRSGVLGSVEMKTLPVKEGACEQRECRLKSLDQNLGPYYLSWYTFAPPRSPFAFPVPSGSAPNNGAKAALC